MSVYAFDFCNFETWRSELLLFFRRDEERKQREREREIETEGDYYTASTVVLVQNLATKVTRQISSNDSLRDSKFPRQIFPRHAHCLFICASAANTRALMGYRRAKCFDVLRVSGAPILCASKFRAHLLS